MKYTVDRPVPSVFKEGIRVVMIQMFTPWWAKKVDTDNLTMTFKKRRGMGEGSRGGGRVKGWGRVKGRGKGNIPVPKCTQFTVERHSGYCKTAPSPHKAIIHYILYSVRRLGPKYTFSQIHHQTRDVGWDRTPSPFMTICFHRDSDDVLGDYSSSLTKRPRGVCWLPLMAQMSYYSTIKIPVWVALYRSDSELLPILRGKSPASAHILSLCIDDVTSVYFQQMQGIGLSIHLNELLHYAMALYRACATWREF